MALDSCTSFKGEIIVPKFNPFLTALIADTCYHPGLGAVLIGHKCFVFGGSHSGYHVPPARYLYIFDTQKNVWTYGQVQNMAAVFGENQMAFVKDDKVVAYTRLDPGYSYGLATLDAPIADEWLLVDAKNAPNLRKGAAGCFVERRNEAMVFGLPRNVAAWYLSVHVFSFLTSEWYRAEAIGSPPSARESHAVCCEGTQVFVVGGRNIRGPHVAFLDLYILATARKRLEWSSPKIDGYVPRCRQNFQVTSSHNRLFIFGGEMYSPGFDIFLIREKQWKQLNENAREPHQIPLKIDRLHSSQMKRYASAITTKALWIFGGDGALRPQSPLRFTSQQST